MTPNLGLFDTYTAFSSRVRGFEAKIKKGSIQNYSLEVDEYIRKMHKYSDLKYFKVRTHQLS